MLAEKFTGMEPDGKRGEHWEECRTFWMVQKEKEHIDSIQGHTFQEVQWAQCQFISAKHTSFREGLSEHMKGKLEMTTCRIKTLWLPSPNLKATLKTYSGKSIRRFYFWPVLHSTLYPEQITSPVSLSQQKMYDKEGRNGWFLRSLSAPKNAVCLSCQRYSRLISIKKSANC